MTHVNDQIFEKIKKLLALADNNPNEHEAAVALEKVSFLLAEHNLSLSQVAGKRADDEMVEENIPSAILRQGWAKHVWHAVSELNFCYYYTTQPHDAGVIHHVIGTVANTASVKVMATYLIETVERLAGEAPITGHERPAFKLGCAHRLYCRLMQLKRDRAKGTNQTPSAGTTTLPALADLYKVHEAANMSFHAAQHPRMKMVRGTTSSTKNAAAYKNGYAAGETIGLETQVGKSKRQMIR